MLYLGKRLHNGCISYKPYEFYLNREFVTLFLKIVCIDIDNIKFVFLLEKKFEFGQRFTTQSSLINKLTSR